MTYSEWNVNTKFFKMIPTPIDSTETSEFIGGRKIVRLTNTRHMKELEFSVSLNVVSGEYDAFWAWFDSIGGKAGIFHCAVLGSDKYWRFTAIPSGDDTSMDKRVITIKCEEVY